MRSMLSLVLAATVLASTADVANGLRNLARMHEFVKLMELRRATAVAIPVDAVDPWGNPYRVAGDLVVSAGSDGKFEEQPAAGQFTGTEGDVVFANGVLVRSNRNWLAARVEPGTETERALVELREAEMNLMMMRTPVLRDIVLARVTLDTLMAGTAKVDGWGTPLRFDGARTISAGADRQFDPMSWNRAATDDLREDIILENGSIVRGADLNALLRRTPLYLQAIPQPVDASDVPAGPYHRVDPANNILAPKALNRVEPVYPEEYRRARIRGIVIVQASISDHGVVEDVRLLKSVAPDLDAAAIAAVRQWTFEPGRMDGKPVPVIFNLTVNFTLK